MLLAYCMLNFTQIVHVIDPMTHEAFKESDLVNTIVEWIALGLVSFMILVNVVAMIKYSIIKLILAYKKRKVKSQAKKIEK